MSVSKINVDKDLITHPLIQGIPTDTVRASTHPFTMGESLLPSAKEHTTHLSPTYHLDHGWGVSPTRVRSGLTIRLAPDLTSGPSSQPIR